MKSVTVLVSFLCLVPVRSYVRVPYELWKISNESAWAGIDQRIYGGNVASEGEFPFMIFAMMWLPGDNVAQCSASLVAPQWVLLAAHCLYFRGLRGKDIILVGGRANLQKYVRWRQKVSYDEPVNEEEFELQERRGARYHIHPEYNDKTLQHDVALVLLDRPFVLGKVLTIPLATEEMTSRRECTILGWGLTRGSFYPKYKLNFASGKEVSTMKIGCLIKTEEWFICLKPGDSGICQGDSGSPLVCGGKVWGVASHFVIEDQNGASVCGDSIEEYYTELYPDIKWILGVMDAPGSAYSSTAMSFQYVLASALAALFYGRM